MDIAGMLLTVLGLVLFESITSIDNAVINAEVLNKMSERAKRWFLTFGLLISVFLVRGILPLLIVWAASPQLRPVGAFFATFSSDPLVVAAVEQSSPILLAGGGV